MSNRVNIKFIGTPADVLTTMNSLRFIPGIGQKRAERIVAGQEMTLTTSPEGVDKINLLAMKGVVVLTRLDNYEPQNEEIPVNIPVTPAAVAAAPAAAPAADLGALLAAAVLPAVQGQIATLVDRAIEGRIPREIVIKQADRPDFKVEGHTHPQFEKVLRLAKQGVNVMLVGPAGCGKTHLFAQVADALGLPHSGISLSGGVTEAHLTGRLLPTGEGGRFVYTQSPFVRRYSEGGAFLLDEMDGADPNVMLAINQALANGGFDIEARAASGLDTFVKRHENALIMATANTFGTGAGALYVGRNQLDAATLDRWFVVQMDYDKAYEEKLAPAQVTHFVWRLRDLITANRWRRVASTRMIQKAAAALAAGLDWATVRGDLLNGYTADELAKINF